MSDPNFIFRIKTLTSVGSLRQCVEIQREIWSWSDEDLLPLRTLLLLKKIGGQVLGALDASGKVMGFINAFPGYRDGKVYLHSQMLGVRKEFQGQGLGKQLKLAQREEAIHHGIQRIEWTFDPLETRNAQLNLESLGVICRRYVSDAYGPSTSSLHGTLPTDRLVAEWYISSERVKSRINLNHVARFLPVKATVVELPADIGQIKLQKQPTAAVIQNDFKNQIILLLEKDYCVTAFSKSSDQSKVFYYLEPFNQKILDS